jgi:hypothetical protein
MTLKTISTAELQAELARRQKSARGLADKRVRVARELQAVEAELALLCGRKPAPVALEPPTRGPRAHNAMTLPEALAAAVKPGEVVSPQEAAARVKAAGFESGARTFGMMVATALAKDKRFRRQSRGRYERLG